MKRNSQIKKYLTIGYLLLIIGTSIIPSIAQTTENASLPNSRGNWLYVGGSGLGNYTKIQDAINNSQDKDTIFVYNGTYYENLVINQSGISVIGENRNATIIDGNNQENVILILEDFICIKEFTVQNSGDDKVGIAVQILFTPLYNIKNINISNCIIKNNNLGILFNNVTNSSLINCHLYNLTSQSITIRLLSENISINNCTINNNGEEVGEWTKSGCIYIDGENDYNCSNITLSYNDINNIIGEGVSIIKSKNIDILHNNIYKNSYKGISIGSSEECNIYYNNIFENTNNGIIVTNSTVQIDKNHIYNNGIGGFFDGGIIIQECIKSVTVNNNDIEKNSQYGIFLIRSSINSITENNFIQNKCNAYFLQFSLFNQWKYNYWDDWIGLGPKIIKGFLGINSVRWMNFDWYPTIEQNVI